MTLGSLVSPCRLPRRVSSLRRLAAIPPMALSVDQVTVAQQRQSEPRRRRTLLIRAGWHVGAQSLPSRLTSVLGRARSVRSRIVHSPAAITRLHSESSQSGHITYTADRTLHQENSELIDGFSWAEESNVMMFSGSGPDQIVPAPVSQSIEGWNLTDSGDSRVPLVQ